MDHIYKNLPIEDEILDAIRSGAEPDTILSLLDTMLAETNSYRNGTKKSSRSFFKWMRDKLRGKKEDLQEITDRTLRSARFFLKTKKSWSPKTKLTYLQKKISFVLDRHPSRGFLSSLCRELYSYLNPTQYNMWRRLEKSGKNISPTLRNQRLKRSKSSIYRSSYSKFDDDLYDDNDNNDFENEKDFAGADDYENYDETDEQIDDEDDDEKHNINFHSQKKYNPIHYKKVRKSNKEKKFEAEDEAVDENDETEETDIRKPSNNVKRHKRIRVLSKSDENRTNEKQNKPDNDKIQKNVETQKNEESNPKIASEKSLSSDNKKTNDQNTKEVAPEKNPANLSSTKENSTTTVSDEKK